MTAGLAKSYLNQPLSDGEWSLKEILGHLRSCADVWSYSVYAMLVEPEPALPRLHPRQWNKIMKYELIDYQASLIAYQQQRLEFLAVLNRLDTRDWERGAEIDGRRHTVYSQIRRMAKHELNHLDQIRALVES